MKVTKFVHSCLLIEENNKTALIDPGIYSEKAIDLSLINSLDYLLITHEHPDHLHIPLIKSVLNKFSSAKVISNDSVLGILKQEGIKGQSQDNNSTIKLEVVPHENVFGTVPPKNVSFNIFGQLTHPGDSLHFNLNTPILALPVQAPWCSLTEAVAKAEELKPKVIIPIHDWHWNEVARENFYQRLKKYFDSKGIRFISPKTAQSFEL